MEILCFGAFAKVLKLNSNISADKNLIGILLKTINKNIIFHVGEGKVTTAVSRLVTCKGDFSRGEYKTIRLLAQSAVHIDVASAFNTALTPIDYKTVHLIYRTRARHVVLALLDIIRNDITLNDEPYSHLFQECFFASPKELDSQDVFVLPDFLASVLLYTVKAGNNKNGIGCNRNQCLHIKGGRCNERRNCVQFIDNDYIEHIYSHNQRKINIVYDYKERDSTPDELSAEQLSMHMSAGFVNIIDDLGIMKIINRKPAILSRIDSTKMNMCLDRIDALLVNPPYSKYGPIKIINNIQSFTGKLRIQALSIEATMNRRFDYDNGNAYINMEIDDNCSKAKRKVIPRKKSHLLKIPELSAEIVLASHDPLRILEIGIKTWGNFRDEMNSLYNEIYALQQLNKTHIHNK